MTAANAAIAPAGDRRKALKWFRGLSESERRVVWTKSEYNLIYPFNAFCASSSSIEQVWKATEQSKEKARDKLA